jgi:hypothetical protein
MKQLLISITILAGMVACNNKLPEQTYTYTEKSIGDTSTVTSCPYFTEDAKGRPVLSWVKEINDSVAVLCYAISNDQGNTFGNAVEVPPSKNIHPHGENLPKVLFKPNGEIIAMWGASNQNPRSKYSGLVYYSQSFDEGKTWGKAIPLVTDTSAYDQRYFDMELLPGGEAMVIWLDNRGNKTKEGSTLFCSETQGKNGFTNERAIGETCCPCCRTDLFIDAKGNVHASYRDIINDSIRDMVKSISTDGGKTFSAPVRISADNWAIDGCPHTGPAVAQNANGMHFAWYTMGGGEGVFYCNSKDSGKTYSKRDTVSANASAKHPQIASLSNGNIIIVWDQVVKTGERYNARIGFQERSPEGKILNSEFISSADAYSEFSVIKPLSHTAILVAYTKKVNDRKQAVYRVIPLTP